MDNLPVTESSCLIVDADAAARTALADGLARLGYRAQQAASSQEALQLLRVRSFAVLLLEPYRLGANEGELLRQARELDPALIVIIITAHPTIESTIAAIRANIFDYLLKPCSEAEVSRSLNRALGLRNKQSRQDRVLAMVRQVMSELEEDAPEPPVFPEAGGNGHATWFELNREKRIVILHTAPPQSVELTEGEIALLGALMEKPNKVMTCAQLAHTALGYSGMDKWTVESVIRSSIFRLRQKLEPSPDAPKLIHTVRGRGYYFSVSR